MGIDRRNPLLSDGQRDFLLLVLGALMGFVEIFMLLLGGLLHGLLLGLRLIVLDLVRALIFLRKRAGCGGEEREQKQRCCEFLHSEIETLRVSGRSGHSDIVAFHRVRHHLISGWVQPMVTCA